MIEEGSTPVNLDPAAMLYFLVPLDGGRMTSLNSAPDSSHKDASASSHSSARGLVVLVLVLTVFALFGGLYGRSVVGANAPDADDLQDSAKSFARVLAVVERNYADPVDTDRVIYDGAIPGMLHVLDPHSNFFDPKQYALFREEQEGKYYGVGMVVQQRENQTVVQDRKST